MKFLATAATCTLLAASCAASNVGVVADRRLAHGWRALEEPVDRDAPVEFSLGMVASDGGALDKAFAEITSPESARFRNYLSHDEVEELVSPSPASLAKLRSWVESALPNAELASSKHGDLVTVKGATAAAVERAFGIRLQHFSHASASDKLGFRSSASFRRQIRTSHASRASPASLVPAELREHVTGVFGLVELFPVPSWERKMRSESRVGADFKGVKITPAEIISQYALSSSDAGGKTATGQGVAAFEDAQFRQEDVTNFQKKYNLPAVDVAVVGPNNGGYFGEASLDTQYITASGRGIATTFLSQEQFDMQSFCQLIAGLSGSKMPKVVSISWGSGESGYDKTHMTAASTCFQKLGTMGVSIFVASGDDGTGKQGLFTCKAFDAVWPASSPYITAVGGTWLDAAGGSGKEHGWAYSGGGFSTAFEMPSWQNETVAAYLEAQGSALPSSKLWPRGGRAIPDVAAVGTHFQVESSGYTGDVTGTSASCPTFAGLVAVINDMLVAKGKAPVGFINPLLYRAKKVGYDVTDGNNKVSGCAAGFAAAQGWDPVTGLGTPVMSTLKEVLMG